jgi:integrase
MRSEKFYPLWMLLATTGMRRGEVLGLRWCDVDLERAEAAVRQTVVSHNYKIDISEPKTARGRRVVALDEHTVAELRSYKQRDQPSSEAELLFHYRTGNPINPIDISKGFIELGRAAGLPRIKVIGIEVLSPGVNFPIRDLIDRFQLSDFKEFLESVASTAFKPVMPASS